VFAGVSNPIGLKARNAASKLLPLVTAFRFDAKRLHLLRQWSVVRLDRRNYAEANRIDYYVNPFGGFAVRASALTSCVYSFSMWFEATVIIRDSNEVSFPKMRSRSALRDWVIYLDHASLNLRKVAKITDL
jgi:hypothetical protein